MKIFKIFAAGVTTVMAYAVLFTMPLRAQEKAKLSDAEIASVAVVANQVDINYATIAEKKSKNNEIVQFAKTMSADHGSVIKQASTLVKKLGVTPKDNAISQKLLSDAEVTKKTLAAKSGNDFNKAYINNEVAYHQAVIAAVEGRLIPEAQNSELKSLLQGVLPVLKSHLEHARMVQKTISGQ